MLMSFEQLQKVSRTLESFTRHTHQPECEAKPDQIILTGNIDNDIYSTVDACRMQVKCGKPLNRMKQETEEKQLLPLRSPTYDPRTATVTEDDEMSKKKIDKLMAFKIFSSINENLQPQLNVAVARKLGFSVECEQAEWKDDIDDESEDHELEAHLYVHGTIQEVYSRSS
ncbi:hypothetical protein Tco_0756025 [Tanacetum coccineum]